MATAGWSMGGGGTMLAANSTPSLKASMSMCPWNPGASYSMMTVPSLQFGGGQIGLSWLKVFLECDARYKQFLKKPGDASEWQTTVQTAATLTLRRMHAG
jgi:dienelactone hydrolase